MRIVIAPDSFKQSLAAVEVADAMARGVSDVAPDAGIDRCPVADGGEGTLDALVAAMGGRIVRTRVTGPVGEPVEARWAVCDDERLGVIEMAEAAGLAIVPLDRRDPTRTTTFGVGQLMTAAIDAGCQRLLLCIGGSGTSDGGIGMLQALGAVVTINGATPSHPLAGGDLSSIESLDLAPALERIAQLPGGIDVACDVNNPLFGPRGSAYVYGPQKGATPEQVESLDAGLRRLASLAPDADPDAPGSGAAGGIGFALGQLLHARLRPGIELVLEAIGFDERVAGADLVITGEGRLDTSSTSGKACSGVASAAMRHGVPTVAVVGSIAAEADPADVGLADVEAICDGRVSLEQAMSDAGGFVRQRTASLVRRRLGAVQ